MKTIATLLPDTPSEVRVVTQPAYLCEFCNDLGEVRANLDHLPREEALKHWAFGRMFPCPKCEKGVEIRRYAMEMRYKRAGLEGDYQKFTFEGFERRINQHDPQGKIDWRAGKENALAACKLFARTMHPNVPREQRFIDLDDVLRERGEVNFAPTGRTKKRSLVLCGPPGTGKTGLVACIINSLINAGVQIVFIRARELARDVQDAYRQQKRYGDDSENSATEVLDKYRREPLLAIDDFNFIRATDDKVDIFTELINWRYQLDMPTLFTCNITQDEFEDQFGLAAASRMKAMAHWLVVGGASLRPDEGMIED